MENTPNLSQTAYGGAWDAQIAASVPGMAHFALTGPADTTCRQCQEWGASTRFRRADGGRLCRRTCQRFIRMCQLDRGIPLAPETPSCRYFVRRDAPPDLVKPRKPAGGAE